MNSHLLYRNSLVLLAILSHSLVAAQVLFPPRGAGEARERAYDVLHYRIEVVLNEREKSVDGKVSITLVPFLPRLQSLEFDAEQMRVHRVTLASGTPLQFEMLPKTLRIALERIYTLEDTLRVSVEYSCTPERGLYFVTPDSGYPERPWQIWTQGEDMDNHFWFPCYDFPNDVATSEVIATVNRRFTVVSNGKLIAVKENPGTETRTHHWRLSKPHVSYLIMLAAGDYAVLKDRVESLPLEYYVYPHHRADAEVCFRETPAMLRFFNERIGFPYPWEKYAQILCNDFVVGGMENTSATTLADNSTVFDARALLHDSPTSLIAHELAHQWWGDVVTCKDWRHLWLNEGFASYFDPLYHEYSLGRDEFDVQMYSAQLEGISCDKANGRKPIVSVGSYGANLYSRGASVLHMLRFVLGDELFWRAVRHYIAKHEFSPVETSDLEKAVEEATGRNLYWFFDQWVYKAGYPIFALSSRWNDTTDQVLLSVRQTQTLDSLTGVFRTPVEIEVVTPVSRVTRRVEVMTADTVFAFPVPARPTLVVFDKGNWLLKELQWDKTADEWAYQAAFAEYPVDRMRALEQLPLLPGNGAFISLVGRVARSDNSWSVRRKAVATLSLLSDSTEELLRRGKEALLAACGDPNARVRAEAVTMLRTLRGDDVVAQLHRSLKDSSYAVVASALRSLAVVDSAHAAPLLAAHLDIPSHGNSIENAALEGLASVDTAQALSVSLKKVRYGEPQWTRYTALHLLGKYGKNREDVRALITALAGDKNRVIQSTAIGILGTIGDEAAVPILEKIAADSTHRSSAAARESLGKIKIRTHPYHE